MNCPLCSNTDIQHFHQDVHREYLHCSVCELVFAHPETHLSREEEYERYQHHENDMGDPRYRNFLSKMSDPMLKRIPQGSKGLDFGSGPGPLLSRIFEEHGHNMSVYDVFYAPDKIVLKQEYDFITATEVAEHLHHPYKELERLWAILKPGGFLGIMTSMRVPGLDFSKWHYINDDTHVIFFAPETMTWLARRWGAKVELINDSVVVFQKEN